VSEYTPSPRLPSGNERLVQGNTRRCLLQPLSFPFPPFRQPIHPVPPAHRISTASLSLAHKPGVAPPSYFFVLRDLIGRRQPACLAARKQGATNVGAADLSDPARRFAAVGLSLLPFPSPLLFRRDRSSVVLSCAT